MKSSQVRALFCLTFILAWLDLFINTKGWSDFPGWILLSWIVVWLIIYNLVPKFWLSAGLVIVLSSCEDFIYIATEALFGYRPWYPVYSHTWVYEATSGLAGFMGWNWLGLPSGYYISLAVLGVIIWKQYHRRAVSQK